MKQIINKVLYDTAKAEQIAEYENTCNITDFRHYSETLYRTKTKKWFLHATGGPLSKYAEMHQGYSTGGTTIVPLSPEEALDWLERTDNVEIAIKYFKEEIEDA